MSNKKLLFITLLIFYCLTVSSQGIISATKLETVKIEGDAFFAIPDPSQWQETSRTPQPAENGLSYDLVEYQRRV